MYNKQVMDHFLRPRNVGTIDDAAQGSGRNDDCGDTVVLSLRVVEGVIEEARFASKGCAGAIACSSATTELLTGSTLENFRSITAEELAEYLGGLPDAKMGCAAMATDAARAAIEQALNE